MQLYYVEELNLKEIGEVLGVSESRVSQILSTVVKKLRSTLQIENEPMLSGKRKKA
jgi:RNA polymerase sigma factor for flagellar operon FliA